MIIAAKTKQFDQLAICHMPLHINCAYTCSNKFTDIAPFQGYYNNFYRVDECRQPASFSISIHMYKQVYRAGKARSRQTLTACWIDVPPASAVVLVLHGWATTGQTDRRRDECITLTLIDAISVIICVLFCKEIQVSTKIKVLPSATLSQTMDIENCVLSAYSSTKNCINRRPTTRRQK